MCLNSLTEAILEISNGAQIHKNTSVVSQKETQNQEFDMKMFFFDDF